MEGQFVLLLIYDKKDDSSVIVNAIKVSTNLSAYKTIFIFIYSFLALFLKQR